MTDPELTAQCESLAASMGAVFAIEPVVVGGCWPGALADKGGYLAVITVRSQDPDDSLHPWTTCGRGRTRDDSMRELLAHDGRGGVVKDGTPDAP